MSCNAGRRRPGRIAELTEQPTQVEERLSRLVITWQTVNEVLGGGADAPPTAEPGGDGTAVAGRP